MPIHQDSLMKRWINGKFEWQTDLSIHLQPFTIDQCYQLHQNQEEHHKTQKHSKKNM
jgi:hypothetical protein